MPTPWTIAYALALLICAAPAGATATTITFSGTIQFSGFAGAPRGSAYSGVLTFDPGSLTPISSGSNAFWTTSQVDVTLNGTDFIYSLDRVELLPRLQLLEFTSDYRISFSPPPFDLYVALTGTGEPFPSPTSLTGATAEAKFRFPGTIGAFGAGTYSAAVNTPAVPDPATWSLMLLGLGIAGARLRLQRNHQRSRCHAS